MWRRQPDGSWKWIYDGGVGPIAEAASLNAPGAIVPTAPTATRGETSAVAVVTALEQAGDIAGRIAPDARVFRTRQAMAAGVFNAPAGISYRVSRTEASAGGDLVMVLGEASWSAEGQAVSSLYARMWQRQAEGWQVVYDQLIVPRPNPAPG